ncbi:SRPBCC family protein [Janibacter terrae]|uniref:SRPBCC family protein n=1 Tax=Janibacter terrae TaxID=103817 RepID=A0ABZ2FBY4_9MICO
MTSPRFVFRHVWELPGPPGDVVEALADVEHYSRWWPQVRSVEPLGDGSGRAVIRSLLPLTLHLLLLRETEDREGGRLRVRLDGDLVGWARWSVDTAPGGSRALFEQDVRVAARWSRAATLAPAVLRANHAWMMRQGRAGLARELSPRR